MSGPSSVASPHGHPLTPPVLNFISKVILPEQIHRADDDPEETLLYLHQLHTRLCGEIVTNPALATKLCPGMNCPSSETRVTALFRNEVMVVTEMTRAIMMAITTATGLIISTHTEKIHSNETVVVTKERQGTAQWPYTNIGVIKPPTCSPKMVRDAVNEFSGSPISDSDSIEFCRKHLFSKGSDRYNLTWNLMVGRAIAFEAHQHIVNTYHYTSDMWVGERAILERFSMIIIAASRVCTFERIGDLFLSQILRTKLYAERLALLGWLEMPMRQIPEQFGEGNETNLIVRPYIDISAADQVGAIDFKTCRQGDAFVLVVSILQELLDSNNIRLFCNSEIPFSEKESIPQPFVVCGNFDAIPSGFGIVENKQLYVLDSGCEYPICAILVSLLRRRVAVSPTPSIVQFLQCCTEEHPTASNPFLRYLDPDQMSVPMEANDA